MKFPKIFIFTIILYYCAASGIAQNDINLVGNWKGTDYWNNKSKIEFTKDSIVTFTINGKPFGGANFDFNGTKCNLKYEIKQSENPIEMDWVAYENEAKIEKKRINGILRFIDKNNAEILIDFNGGMPNDFNKENEQSVMKIERIE